MIALYGILHMASIFFAKAYDVSCALYVGQSMLSENMGMGVFAGRNYKKNEVIERCIVIPIPVELIQYTLLDNYVFGDDRGALVVLGYAMVYNHDDDSSVHYGTANHLPSYRSIDGSPDSFFYASHDIKEGEEIFSQYGGERWFAERKIPYIKSKLGHSTLNNSIVFPGCPASLVEIVGGRLFATQIIYPGDIIEVARGLVIAGNIANSPNLAPYVWRSARNYDEHETEAASAMLLLGYGALYGPKHDKNANVAYDWWTVDNIPPACSELMYISFTATDMIYPNEELVIDLQRDGNGNRYVNEHLQQLGCF